MSKCQLYSMYETKFLTNSIIIISVNFCVAAAALMGYPPSLWAAYRQGQSESL